MTSVKETKEDTIAVCSGCGAVFAAEIDTDGAVRALGVPDNQCCEGDTFQVIEDGLSSEFAEH